MASKEMGLWHPDGSFESEQSIKRRYALRGDLPVFDTPLPLPRDFDYWSNRFQERQRQYNETAEVERNHVEITLPGASVINFVGDIHIGSPETNYQRLAQEIEVITNTPNSYVMLMGDLVDGFFWNPAQMEQMEQPPEQYAYARSLIQHLGKTERLLVGWGGDHDTWAKKMGMSAYTTFAEEARAHYMYGVGYVTLHVGGQDYFLTGAHRLPGHSMYNKNHPGMRAEKFGGARGSDIVVHGHTHQKGYAQQPVQEFGGVGRNVHFISIGPYKQTDGYARKLGLGGFVDSPNDMYGSAIILHEDAKRVQYFSDILIANQEIDNLL